MWRFLEARKFALAFLMCLFILYCPVPVTASNLDDLEWVKHDTFVLDLGTSGSWDADVVFYPTVVRQDSNFEMVYTGIHNSDRSYEEIGYAISSDGINWLKGDSNPVLKADSWDSYQIYSSSIYLKADSQYNLYYSGYPGSTDTAIGYATSPDGITWTKHIDDGLLRPVLKKGEGSSWDNRYVDNPSVIFDDGIYKMWYEGVSNGMVGAIGYATSPDGSKWTKSSANPVFDRSDRETRPNVIKDGSTYYMFYKCIPALDAGSVGICYATSLDGIDWTASLNGPILTAGPGAWDALKVDQPYVIKDGDTFKMWYTGTDSSGHMRIGYAYAKPKNTECSTGPEQGLLDRLNNYPYDFYNEYYNYENSAVKPDEIKTCYTGVDSDDTWMIRSINGSYAMYPMKVSFLGPDLGIDFNEWYSWNTPVITPIPGESKTIKLSYPELKFNISGLISSLPSIKGDAQKVSAVKKLINSTEYSLELNGLFAKGPINTVNSTRAEISTEYSGKLITPLNLKDLDCKGTYSKYYDSDAMNLSEGWNDQIGCQASDKLGFSNVAYTQNLDLDAGLVTFKGNVLLELALDPTLETGVNLRPFPPSAIVAGGKTNLSVNANALLQGDACTNKGCFKINRSLDLPKISNFSALSEVASAFADFKNDENVRSMLPRLSDNKTVEYRGLKSLSPVFRIEGSEIKVSADICFNLSDLGIPCGSFLDCKRCLLKGEVLKINPWNLYSGQAKIIVHSPVEINIYDEYGSHTGPNSTGGFDYEIEGSNYTELNGEKVLSFTTNTERFILVLNGTDTGTYNLTVLRPIMITLPNGTIVFQEVSYETDFSPTNKGQLDYYFFDFAAIENLVNRKVNSGEDIDQAIDEALKELVIRELGSTLKPSIIEFSPQQGANGEMINLTARLLSFSNPLSGKNLKFYVDGIEAGSKDTNSSGGAYIEYEIPSSLSYGSHELKVAFDGDSNYQKAQSISTLEIINSPPKVSLEVPEFVSGTVQVKGTVEDTDLDTYSVLIDGRLGPTDLIFQWNSTKLPDGLHLIELEAQDKAGQNASAIKLIFVDNNPPEITVSGIEEGKYYNKSVTPEISITDAWLKESSLLLDGSPYQNGTEISTEGKHTLEVSAEDYLGHVANKKIEFFIDKTPPSITIKGISNGAVYTSPINVTYGVSDNLDKNPVIESNYSNGTVFNKRGNYTIWVSARDAAGNSARKEATFSLDFDCLQNKECSAAEVCLKNLTCQKAFAVQEVTPRNLTYREGDQIVLLVTVKSLNNLNVLNQSIEVYKDKSSVIEVLPSVCLPLILKQSTLCMYSFKAGSAGSYFINAKINGQVIGEKVSGYTVSSCKKCWKGCC